MALEAYASQKPGKIQTDVLSNARLSCYKVISHLPLYINYVEICDSTEFVLISTGKFFMPRRRVIHSMPVWRKNQARNPLKLPTWGFCTLWNARNLGRNLLSNAGLLGLVFFSNLKNFMGSFG